MYKVVIIDGQGGRIGRALIERLKAQNLNCEIFAIGTNVMATSAMIKGGADYSATGENPVVVNVRDADLVAGPIGITVADALLGEVTAKMAVAVGGSKAQKVLLPINKCKNYVVGVKDENTGVFVDSAVEYIVGYLSKL